MKRLLVGFSILMLLTVSVTSVFSQKRVTRSKVELDAVEFGKTSVISDGSRVWLEWNTDDEINNFGFNIYRVNGKQKVLVNQSVVLGTALVTGDKTSGGSYSLLDDDGTIDSSYLIEAISIGGKNKTLGPLYPQFVNDLSDKIHPTSELSGDTKSKGTGIVINNSPIVPKELSETNKSSNFTISDAQTTQFWIASQTGAKIGVTQTGFHRVLRAQLQAAGFDVNAATNLWQLYADGIEQPIIVGPNGSYIEFYGVGLDELTTNKKTYYAVVGPQNGKRISSTFRRSIREGVVNRSFDSKFERIDNGSTYVGSVLNGDADNFFGQSFNSSGLSLTINVPGVDTAFVGSFNIDVRIQGLLNTPHLVAVFLNDQQIGTISGNNLASMNLSATLSNQNLLNGNNVVRLVGSGSNDYSMIDRIAVTYKRRYAAASNRLNFSVPNYKTISVEGFSSPNVRLFDMTDASNPVVISNAAIRQNGATYDLVIPSNKTRMMYAIADEGLLTPASVVANVPSTLSSVTKQADLVIISHSSLMQQAQDWATYRRNQGMLVEVVDSEDVYDEFGFGVSGPEAIKAFLGYAKASWLVKPNYVLLVGDATFDYRNYLGNAAPYNLVPSKLFDSSYSETASDEYLVDFNNDGLAELAIGRIPVISGASVTQILNKTIAFETTRSTALMQRGAMFVSDLPNGWDFEGTNNRLRLILPAGMPATMINRAQVDSRAQILATADAGKFMIHWSGHGSVSFWATAAFYSRDDAFAMNNGNNLSIFTLLTCLNGMFHNNATDSFSESGLKAPNGGAVAAWASTGLTTPDVQEVMATRYYQKIADGSIERLGDLIKDAKTTLAFGRDVRLSWALLGDPTLRVK